MIVFESTGMSKSHYSVTADFSTDNPYVHVSTPLFEGSYEAFCADASAVDGLDAYDVAKIHKLAEKQAMKIELSE